jgi:WD40 repeat protein
LYRRRLSLRIPCRLLRRIWELESGRELQTLSGHAGVVLAVAVTPDGRRALSASWDKTLKVWDLESGRELM